jgi:acetyl-CoA carboxylase biotin carboxyl carrier protein
MLPTDRRDKGVIRASPGGALGKSDRTMKKPQQETAETVGSGLDLSVVAALAQIAARHDLSEVEIEHGGLRVRVARERRALSAAHVAAIVPTAPPPEESAPAPASPATHPGSVKSPMVGTAYLRPNPESRPFVEVGSLVKEGDKLLLVEAMKTFNEIVAPKSGKVIEIHVDDGTPVEYGQALMTIE